MKNLVENYDIVVVGAGHAGCPCLRQNRSVPQDQIGLS